MIRHVWIKGLESGELSRLLMEWWGVLRVKGISDQLAKESNVYGVT